MNFIDTNTLFAKVNYTGKDLRTKGLGGSEAALIHLAENMPGSRVYNYTEVPSEYNGVFYQPFKAEDIPNEPMFIQRSIANIETIPHGSVLLLHDQTFDDPDFLRKNFDNGNLKCAALLSDFQARLFIDHVGEEYTSRLFKYRNGSDFVFNKDVKRNPNKFLYAHNPWRGLENLLQMWPNIQLGIPQAELHVFSGGFFDTDKETQDYYEWLKVEYSALTNVYFNPLISEDHLEYEYQTSHLYLYPGTTPETFGICTLHAIATGTPIVMNAVYGLVETAPEQFAKHAFFGDTQREQFIAHIMRLYYDKDCWTQLHNNSRTVDCSWKTVAKNLLEDSA